MRSMSQKSFIRITRSITLLPLVTTSLLGACTDLVLDADGERHGPALYDELWESFNAHYAPFGPRGVDWAAAYDRHLPPANADEDVLFRACSALLAELDDGHVTLLAPGRPVFVAQRTFREHTFDLTVDLGIVFQKMVRGPFRSGAARYGTLPGDIAYVHVAHWEDPIPDLDDLMAFLRGRAGVIIDMRHNPGGDFRNGFEFASRFADRRRHAFTTTTKTGPGAGDIGQRTRWHIEPDGPFQITAPIVVLTNGYTNSAAERTLMAFRTMPHVTTIGSRTAGNHGEKVGGELSNGWRFTVVPQIVYDSDGQVFEGAGIPAEVEVANTEHEVIDLGQDRQLEAALEVLAAGTTQRAGPSSGSRDGGFLTLPLRIRGTNAGGSR